MTAINLGTPPTGGDGDSVRDAMTKVKTVIDGLDGATGYVKVTAGEGSAVDAIDPADIDTGTADIDISGSASNLSATLAANKGGTGRATLAAHSVLLGNGTSAVGVLAPAVAGRLLSTTGASSDPAFSVSVSNATSVAGGASLAAAMMSGTAALASQGNLRTTELYVVNKGDGGFSLPQWNSGGQNLNAFGHGCKLLNKTLFTAWSRNTSESLGDGAGQLLVSVSNDYGVSWTAPLSLYTASSGGSFNTLANVTCWQASNGRIFAAFATGNLGTSEVKNMLVWTDDPTGLTGWTSPILAVDPNFTFLYHAVVQGFELADGSGTQVMMEYGKNAGDDNAQRTATMIQSTDGGATWTRRSVMNLYSNTSLELIEACACYRADGVLLASFRNNLNARIYFKTSSDHGLTWSALGSQFFGGAGKPAIVRLTNGTLAVMTRSTSLATSESCLFVCRDKSGMNANSWGTEQDFDPRHFYYYYGGLYEVSPNVLGCNFAGGSPIVSNQTDWSYTMFADGGAVFPTGAVHARDILGNGLGVNRQTVITLPAPIAHVGNSATGTQLATAINALIDQCRSNGTGLQHPADVTGCLGWWEPWQALSTVNDWTDSFTHADSTTVVANATRGSGQAITPSQPKGTWGTSSNTLYLSATTGGSGYEPLITWDVGKGDGIWSVTLPSYTSSTIFALAIRVVDASNFLMPYLDGTNIHLYKVSAGTASDLPSPVSLAISNTNSVVYKIQYAGNAINLFANVNGAGFPTTPQLNYTLTGGDATAYSNANTKVGVVQFATSNNRFSSAIFNDTLTVGDKLGQLVDLSGSGTTVGDLKQATAANQMAWQAMPSLFGGKQFLYCAGAKLSYSTGSFSSLSAPFTLFWAGVLPIGTGATQNLFLIWDGIGTHFAEVGITSSNQFYVGTQAGAFTAPAFTNFPQGPLVLRMEITSGGVGSKLYVNGQLALTFSAGSITGQTLIQYGDSSNNYYAWWLHGSAFNAILTATPAREHERLIAATLGIEGWNPR